MDEIPDICKNCKRSQTIDTKGKKLELCTYKNRLKEIVKITDGDAKLKTHCSFKEEC